MGIVYCVLYVFFCYEYLYQVVEKVVEDKGLQCYLEKFGVGVGGIVLVLQKILYYLVF